MARTGCGLRVGVTVLPVILGAGCAPGPEPLLSQLDGVFATASALGAPFGASAYATHVLVVLGAVALVLGGIGKIRRARSGGDRHSASRTRSAPEDAGPRLGRDEQGGRSDLRTSGTPDLLLALGLGFQAQAVLSYSVGFGVVLYALALWVAFRGAGEPGQPIGRRDLRPRSLALEFCAVSAALALYVLLALWQLDVRPELDFDEFAYLKAVLIAGGDLPTTERIGRVYELARFEALPIAFAWQSVWVWLNGPDVLSTRLASAAACGLALAAAWVIVRVQLGRLAAGIGLVLGASAPLLLAYARLGLQISGSIAHGTVALGLLLLVCQRWRLGSALLLGVVLGASLFFYQLSWFVPVLAVPALAVAVWRDGSVAARRAFGLTLLVAVVFAGSGAVLLRAEFETLWQQTESRRTWETGSEERRLRPGRRKPQERFVHVGTTTPKEARKAARGLHAENVETWMARTDSGAYVLTVVGYDDVRTPVVELAMEKGWRPLSFDGTSPQAALTHALGFLLRDSHLQNPDALIDGPTLRPLLAPLLMVGLARLMGRRRTRGLGLWVLAATLVPVLLSGAETRRVVLAAPLLLSVAAWPISELVQSLRSGWPRVAGGLASAALCAVLAASGLQLAIERWDQRIETTPTPVRMLTLARVLAQLPATERVLIPRGLLTNAFGAAARLAAGVLEAPEAARRFVPVGAAEVSGEGGVLRASCAERLPFTWVVPSRDAAKARFDGLDRDFVLRRETMMGVQLLRVQALRNGGCSSLR